MSKIVDHPIVSPDAWQAARRELLAEEKAFTHARAELARKRRALPWTRVDRAYRFDGPRGPETLSDLFAGRSQLVVYHFMFAPDWEEGCRHCSFWADSFDRIGVHLEQRDVTMVAVSRAPRAKLEAFRQRMGWSFPWFSSHESDFNYDFQASFHPEEAARGEALYNFVRTDPGPSEREGTSVFYKDADGAVFHTYSCYARGIDMMNTAYQYLDLVPKGRDEDELEGPQDWVRHHDRY